MAERFFSVAHNSTASLQYTCPGGKSALVLSVMTRAKNSADTGTVNVTVFDGIPVTIVFEQFVDTNPINLLQSVGGKLALGAGQYIRVQPSGSDTTFVVALNIMEVDA
jgi:hypothetical protein